MKDNIAIEFSILETMLCENMANKMEWLKKYKEPACAESHQAFGAVRALISAIDLSFADRSRSTDAEYAELVDIFDDYYFELDQ